MADRSKDPLKYLLRRAVNEDTVDVVELGDVYGQNGEKAAASGRIADNPESRHASSRRHDVSGEGFGEGGHCGFVINYFKELGASAADRGAYLDETL